MSRSGDFRDDDRQTDRQTDYFTPAHARGVIRPSDIMYMYVLTSSSLELSQLILTLSLHTHTGSFLSTVPALLFLTTMANSSTYQALLGHSFSSKLAENKGEKE